MRNSVRGALLVVVTAAAMATGGAAPAMAAGPAEDALDGVTDQLQTGAEDVGGMLEGGAPDVSGGGLPEMPDVPDTEGIQDRVREFSDGGGEDSPFKPLTELVCKLTDHQVELLGYCPEYVPEDDKKDDHFDDKKDDGYVHVGDKKKDDDRHDDERDDDKHDDDGTHSEYGNDDSGTVPVGGIETGAGGRSDS